MDLGQLRQVALEVEAWPDTTALSAALRVTLAECGLATARLSVQVEPSGETYAYVKIEIEASYRPGKAE